jgi:hypothetical protein
LGHDRAQTREAWLVRAADRLVTEFLLPVNRGATAEFCVSVGFPKGRHGRGKAAGQCWSPKLARDGKAHIFVSPERDGSEAAVVLATVLHELIHATAGCEHGHKHRSSRWRKRWASAGRTRHPRPTRHLLSV